MNTDYVTLPYSKDYLKHFLSSETLEFHHGKHHVGYSKKLLGLIKDTKYQGMSLENVIKLSHKESNSAVYNNATQIWNHDFYWRSIGQTQKPNQRFVDLIEHSFKSYEHFTKKFVNLGMQLFGSGWLWLVKKPNSTELSMVHTHNSDIPIIKGDIPIITIDLWEHAYYIDYRNDKLKYLTNTIKNIQWDFAEKRFFA